MPDMVGLMVRAAVVNTLSEPFIENLLCANSALGARETKMWKSHPLTV